ncbi:MAG: GIY-YIG nuclease family protein [Pseudomonadota bacterium]
MIKGLPNFCVYVLADPDTGEVFYVGETNNFERRKSQHLEGSDQLSGFKVKLLREENKVPIVQVIEHCHSDEAALMAEISWIRHFMAIGAPLLNSQNFDGAYARQDARKKLTGVLDAVTGGKYGRDGLRHVANGKTYHNRGAKHATENPVTQVKGPFSPWEQEKLREMNRKRMKPWDMARVLNRDTKDVKMQLKRMS